MKCNENSYYLLWSIYFDNICYTSGYVEGNIVISWENVWNSFTLMTTLFRWAKSNQKALFLIFI